MNPPPPMPDELIAPPQKPWLTWCLALLLILGVVAWFTGPSVARKTRSYMAQRYAQQASALIAKSEWLPATAALAKARDWSPHHPKVLRVMVDFMVGVNSEPSSILYAIGLLEQTGEIQEDDYLKMGQIYVQQTDVPNSIATLAKLSAATREKRPALELLANIQRLQGKTREAESTLRRALHLEPNDPMCRLRLAILDRQAAFAEMRESARAVLWELAAGKDRPALLAIDMLCQDTSLTAVEADKLLVNIESHPNQNQEARLKVISALMRVKPTQREALLQAELEAAKESSSEDLAALMKWLLVEKEPKLVLALKPRDFCLNSPLLIAPYLQSLADLGRWEEMDRSLSKTITTQVPAGFIPLWRARAAIQLDRTGVSTRHHLSIIHEACGHGRDGPTASQAAAIAEEAGLYDVAAQFYEGLADHQPGLKLPMLEKVYEMVTRGRDGDAMLRTAQRIAALSPNDPRHSDRVLYLNLVSGFDLELNWRHAQTRARSSADDNLSHFLLALASYRLGDLDAMRRNLSKVSDPQSFTAGQRAVFSGMLSISGQIGPAYQIAERVAAILLFKEEQRFLQRAL